MKNFFQLHHGIEPSFLALPISLAPFFQEYDLARLDVQRSASTIIERVLQYGSRAEIRWLFQVYPRQQVSDWVLQWGPYALPEPHLTFWKLVLELADAAWGNLVFLANGLRVGFYGYGYRMAAPLVDADGVPLASIPDIGLMKLDALLGRASRKDFYDLYAICQRMPLRQLLDLAPQKYPGTRDFEAQVVKRLPFFERADQEDAPLLLQDVPWETVKTFFRQQAAALGKSWLL